MLTSLKNHDNVFYTEDDYTQVLQQIKFIFNRRDKFNSKCCNIMTADTETTNAYNDNGVAIPYDADKYLIDEWYREHIRELPACSCLYMWQWTIDDPEHNRVVSFIGRTHGDFINFLHAMTREIKRQQIFGQEINDIEYEYDESDLTKHKCNIYVYWHNMSFDFVQLSNILDDEFGTITHRKYRKYDECGDLMMKYDEEGELVPDLDERTFAHTFARSPRKPMKTYFYIDNVRIEMRCSYVLTGKSLKEWGADEKLVEQKVKVDKNYYYEIRTPLTPLSDEEIEYAVIDTVTMIHGLRSYVKKYGFIWQIPLTATSIVREMTRKTLSAFDPEWQEAQLEIQNSYDYDFYANKLRQLYTGGWTHANAHYVKRVLRATPENPIICHDFASSYPFQMMCCDHLPVSTFHEVDTKTFDDIKDTPLRGGKIVWFGKFKFKKLRSKLQNTFFSLSKCLSINGKTKLSDKEIRKQMENDAVDIDNGRVAYAEEVEMLLSDYEYDIFTKAYDWDEEDCKELYVAQAGRLPDSFIKMLLKLYKEKTMLKHANPSQYRASKSAINGAYGMICTAILTALITYYGGKWHSDETPETMKKLYSKLIDSTKAEKMIAQYPIGIYICKAAMHALWNFIIKFDSRCIYCDTDSLKGFLTNKDLKIIDEYNDEIKKIEDELAAEMGIDPDDFAPVDDEGVPHRIGVFSREHDVDVEMAVLGAKRYFCKWNDTDKNGNNFVNWECTVAGLPKEAGKENYKTAADFINPAKSHLDCTKSGKKICYYTDNQPPVKFVDKYGTEYTSTEKHTCTILPTSFDISLSSTFEMWLNKIAGKEKTGEEFKDDVPEALLWEC